MDTIPSFREPRVWTNVTDLGMEISEATRNFPPEDRYSLTAQIRRSSRSVPANISVGWGKRRSPAAFVRKLNDAEGQAAESQTHLPGLGLKPMASGTETPNPLP